MNPTVEDRRLTPAALIIALFAGLVTWNLPIPTLRGESPAVIEVASFSSATVGQTIPDGWTPLIFKKIPRQTKYVLIKDGDVTVVKAESNASTSGLTRAVTIDPHEYPIIRWRWKVDHVLRHSDVSRKDGDDYPARLYVTFEYDEKRVSFSKKLKYAAGRAILGDIPIGALNYIWET